MRGLLWFCIHHFHSHVGSVGICGSSTSINRVSNIVYNRLTCKGWKVLEMSVNPTMSEKKIVTHSWCSGSTFLPSRSVRAMFGGNTSSRRVDADFGPRDRHRLKAGDRCSRDKNHASICHSTKSGSTTTETHKKTRKQICDLNQYIIKIGCDPYTLGGKPS